jgi:hypothetical protein
MADMDDWKARIMGWFSEGHGGSPDPLNLKWEVSEETTPYGRLISAKHPKIPFEINSLVTEKLVKLGINTGMETDFLEPSDRLKIYKILLTMNSESTFVKIGLNGLESVIIVGADLELPSLDQDEFNTTLSSLVMTTYAVYKYLGKEQELNEYSVQRIIQMAYERLESGGKSSDVIEYLTSKVGLERSSAEELVRSILDSRKEEKEKGGEGLGYIG